MKRKNRWTLLGLGLGCLNSAPAWAFRYSQEIDVPKAGLVRCRLPHESMERAERSEEFRLFDPANKDIPLVVSDFVWNPWPNTPSVEPADVKYVGQKDRSVLTFSIQGEAMDGFELAPQGKPGKSVTVERSSDGKKWETLFEQTLESRLVVGFPATTKMFFRISVNDGFSMPLRGISVRLRKASPDTVWESMPMAFTQSTGTSGLRLEMTPPIRHASVNGLEILGADIVAHTDPNRYKSGHRMISTGKESLPGEGHHNPVEIFCPMGEPAYILVPSYAFSGDDIQWLEIIPLRYLLARVEAARARVKPRYLAFQAPSPGKYVLRFGTETAADPVVVYGELQRDLLKRVKEAKNFLPAAAGPIQVDPSVTAAKRSNLWDPLSQALDTSLFRGQMPLRVVGEGFHSAVVPSTVYGVSTNSADWRMTKNGQELPFLIRRMEYGGNLSVDKLDPVAGKSRYKLAGPMKGLEGLQLRLGFGRPLPSRDTRAQVVDDQGKTLAVATLTNQTVPGQIVASVVTAYFSIAASTDAVFLEVEDGGGGSIKLYDAHISYRGAEVIFRGGPQDDIRLHFGSSFMTEPFYDVRKSTQAPVVEFEAFFVPGDAGGPLKSLTAQSSPAPVPASPPNQQTETTGETTSPRAAASSGIFWVFLLVLGGLAGWLFFGKKRG